MSNRTEEKVQDRNTIKNFASPFVPVISRLAVFIFCYALTYYLFNSAVTSPKPSTPARSPRPQA
ncbi:hypothetical protein, partial [Limnothrix sp. PR1529]|uniref:hypothetical protein n=1 Tax=Limnothrix sp. PR1529 TaxID=1704291 RepID=UPI001F260E7B